MLMSVKSLYSTSVLLRLVVTTQWAHTTAPAIKDILMLTPATLEQIVQVSVCAWVGYVNTLSFSIFFYLCCQKIMNQSKLKKKLYSSSSLEHLWSQSKALLQTQQSISATASWLPLTPINKHRYSSNEHSLYYIEFITCTTSTSSSPCFRLSSTILLFTDVIRHTKSTILHN